MKITTVQQTTTGKSNVGDSIVINYTYNTRENVTVEKASGAIRKDDVIVGYFNTNRTGESGLTFLANADLTQEEKQQIAAQIYTDESEIFN